MPRTLRTDAIFRHAVRERDNWACQECGSVEHPQAHHIKAYNGENSHLENGVTLCVYCHADAHPEVPRQLFISNAVKAEKDGHISAGKLAKELGVHPRTIVRHAVKLGILKPMQQWTFTNQEATKLRGQQYRRKVHPSGTRLCRFNIVLDDDLIEAAKKRGGRLRKSIAEMVREQFVKWYLEENIISEDSEHGEKTVLGGLE